ncbi:MAG: cytochrome c oxidase assembly protein, partial [Solirubrobacteraceae bacterium]
MIVLLIGLGGTAALYALSARGLAWPARRTVAFIGGLVALLAALAPPLGTQDTRLLSLHMVQHGLLTLVAAPLLVSGAPLRLALRRLSGHRRRALGRVLAARPLHVLTRPAVGLGLFAAVLLGTHLTPVYDLAVRNEAVHVTEHAAYFWTAILLWVPLIAA